MKVQELLTNSQAALVINKDNSIELLIPKKQNDNDNDIMPEYQLMIVALALAYQNEELRNLIIENFTKVMDKNIQ